MFELVGMFAELLKTLQRKVCFQNTLYQLITNDKVKSRLRRHSSTKVYYEGVVHVKFFLEYSCSNEECTSIPRCYIPYFLEGCSPDYQAPTMYTNENGCVITCGCRSTLELDNQEVHSTTWTIERSIVCMTRTIKRSIV